MTRNRVIWVSLVLGACGGGGGEATPDAPTVKDIGFNPPTAVLTANVLDGTTWNAVGPADLSCLGTPSDDVATTVAVDLTTTIRDFQKEPPNNLVPGATVSVFPEGRTDMPFAGSPYTADATSAMVTVQIPVGTKRFGFKVSDPTSLDTLLLNQRVMPDVAAQTLDEVQIVSKQTAQSLPAIINVQRTPGTGILAGAMRDCQNREISNFIATVSTTSRTVTHLDGADAYYFSPAAKPLPQRHTQQPASSGNGLFMIIEMAPVAQAYVQVWGFPDDAALAAGELKLVSELPTAIVGDVVITGSYEPLRQ